MTEHVNDTLVEETIKPVKKQSEMKKAVRELFALLLWFYLVVKLFIFDFDVYLIESYMPSFMWTVRFKFLLYLVFLSTYWLLVGDKNFFKTIGYILIYPFILFFWRIPKMLFRNWFLVFTTLSFAVSFFKSFKINIVTFTVISVSTVLILISNQRVLVTACSIVLSLSNVAFFQTILFFFYPSSCAVFAEGNAFSHLG